MSYDPVRNGEADLIRRLKPLQPMVVFDVGANVGEWVKLAAEGFPEARIHAFELSPRTFERLRVNLSGVPVIMNGCGLSDKAGTVEFRDYGDGSAISTMVDSDFHSSVQHAISKATVMTGDEYCGREGIDRIDLLKIDVEGAELRVLAGFARMLDERRIRCLQFEYGFANGDDHVVMRDFHRFLGARGYVVGKLWSKGVAFGPFTYSQNLFTSGPNYVAIHGEDARCRELIEIRR